MLKILQVAAAAVVIFGGATQAEEFRMGTTSVGGAFHPMGQSALQRPSLANWTK